MARNYGLPKREYYEADEYKAACLFSFIFGGCCGVVGTVASLFLLVWSFGWGN